MSAETKTFAVLLADPPVAGKSALAASVAENFREQGQATFTLLVAISPVRPFLVPEPTLERIRPKYVDVPRIARHRLATIGD